MCSHLEYSRESNFFEVNFVKELFHLNNTWCCISFSNFLVKDFFCHCKGEKAFCIEFEPCATLSLAYLSCDIWLESWGNMRGVELGFTQKIVFPSQ